MANRKRNVQLHFMVTEREKELIQEKMAQLGTRNMGAYLRKMAIDGYVVRLDLSEVGELVSLLRRCSNNLNQLTRRAHETGSIYEADIEDLCQKYDCLWVNEYSDDFEPVNPLRRATQSGIKSHRVSKVNPL